MAKTSDYQHCTFAAPQPLSFFEPELKHRHRHRHTRIDYFGSNTPHANLNGSYIDLAKTTHGLIPE